MNFFQQLALAGAGKVDINLRIMQKNDKFTMSILPGSHSSITKPMNITGTAAELDDKFFETIFPQAVEVLGIISNIDDVKKEADKKLSESKNKTPEKSAAKKEEKKPVKDTKKKTSKPEIKEASVFDQQPEDTAEKQTEIEDADTGEAPEAEETNEE